MTEKLANNEKELKEIKDSKQYINSDKNLGNDLNKYLKENTELKNENNKLKEDMEKLIKEKDFEINEKKQLYQKEINDLKLMQILNEEKTEDKMKLLNDENNKYKKEIEIIKKELEVLKNKSSEKDKTIEKLEIEIEKYDYENNDKENIIELNKLRNENDELKQMYKNMTQGINEANQLYNEKLKDFNIEINLKNIKLQEYKNKIIVLKRKINEMYEEINYFRGSSSVNNTSFFSASFINNSIINTNTSKKPYEKFMNNTMIGLNNDINLNESNNTSSIKMRKKLSGLIECNSKTLDRSDMSNNFDKINKMTNTNRKISVNKLIISPHIKKELLFPQTPQVKKDILYNNKIYKGNTEFKKDRTKEFVNKSKEEENNSLNFLKEYKDILEKLTNNINTNLGVNNK